MLEDFEAIYLTTKSPAFDGADSDESIYSKS